MNELEMAGSSRTMAVSGAALGVPGALAVLAGAIGQAVFAPLWMLALVVFGASALAAWLAPAVLRPLLRPRWIGLCLLLVLPLLFFSGPVAQPGSGLAVTGQGIAAAVHALLRMAAILLGVSLFTAQVEISALAGVFERLGLHGLGFSLGVALNLLPGLQQSATTTWRVLQMRGGFRRQRWNGLRLLVLTVVTQALRRAEEIALAAEARAFTPEHAAGYPVSHGRWDGVSLIAAVLLTAAAVLTHLF